MSNLPESWQIVKLGDISNITYGKGLPTKDLKLDGFPVFGANGIIGFYDKYLYESSQLLISCRGANSGTINTSPPQCFVTNNSLIIDFPVQQETLRKICYYFLQTANKERLVTGTAQPQVTINNAIEIEFPLPPLNEQKRIVAKIDELFSEIDKGIESLKTARAQLKVYRQAILKHAFEGKLTAKWRGENKHEMETWEHLFNSISIAELDKLPDIPEAWRYARLNNLGKLGRGKSKHRPRNDPKLFGGIYPFIQTGDIKSANRVLKKYNQTYNNIGLQQSKLWPIGTLCITIAANIAETALLGFDSCFPDSIVGFTANNKLVFSSYVELFIKSTKVKIKTYAPATAQKNINLETLENLIVPLCSLEEQKELINQVEAYFTVIDRNEKEIETNLIIIEALRQSILKTAFSGKLVPQDPNDEPASVLLEHIRVEKGLKKTNGKKPLSKKEPHERRIHCI